MKTGNNIFLKRFFSYLLTLFLLVSLVFILLRLAPGDPTQKFLSPELNPQLAEDVRHSFALDRPVWEQYFYFLKNVLVGNFGVSYNYHLPVTEVISAPLRFTLLFTSASFFIQVSIPFLLVFILNRRRGSLIDKAITKISFLLYSIPTMIIGLLLVYFFSIKLDLLPSSDLKSMDFDDLSFPEKLADYLQHLILPIITISIQGIVVFYSYLRSNIEATYQKNFIHFLRANGIDEPSIFKKHIIPNSLGPLVSIMGVELGILLSGALITETIFSLPGMGRLTVYAILTRDYPLIIGCVFISGIFVLLANFIADIVKIKFDKRLSADLT